MSIATPKAARGTECSDETGSIAAPGNGAVIAIAAGEPLSRVPPARSTKALARDRSRTAETLRGSVHMWTAPDLQGLALAAMLGSLALICPACFRVLRPPAKMGFADSEIRTRERHFLPVNRAEHSTDRLAPNVPPRPVLQVPPPASDLPVRRQALQFVQVYVGICATLLAGRYRSPLTISFQAIRASLFANAMATSFGGLRATMSFSHGQERVSRRRISAITAVAPATKTVRNMPSPARVITPSLFFPAVE